MSDQAPRSAFEIAMERLRQKDRDEGVEHHPRTDEQKAAIAEIRSVYDAKLAQIDVMHASAMAGALDPGVRADLEQGHQRERERLTGERERKIERARLGEL
ncbi:MAG: hypothetical protein ABUS56_07615 [Acidobacteriota bacterium]